MIRFFSAMLDAFRLLVSLCILLTDGGSFQISGPASGEIDVRCFDANFVAFVWTHRVHIVHPVKSVLGFQGH